MKQSACPLVSEAEFLHEEFGYFFGAAWRPHPLPADFATPPAFFWVSQQPGDLAGDSFGAGLIWGLQELGTPAQALEFAVAASALKHTLPGDFNLVSLEEIRGLMNGDTSGRVQR